MLPRTISRTNNYTTPVNKLCKSTVLTDLSRSL